MSNYRIGHAHLKVRDLNKSVDFYTSLLGFHVTERMGSHFAFLTGGDMHHELALQEVGADAPSPHPFGVGLYHIAFEAVDEQALKSMVEKLDASHIRNSLVDHGISKAVYFSDPDGNGLEVYLDTRNRVGGRDQWGGATTKATV